MGKFKINKRPFSLISFNILFFKKKHSNIIDGAYIDYILYFVNIFPKVLLVVSPEPVNSSSQKKSADPDATTLAMGVAVFLRVNGSKRFY